MEYLIKEAFTDVDNIGPHVMEGYYDLVGPQGEIVLPHKWETVVTPGFRITMHMRPMAEDDMENIRSLSVEASLSSRFIETEPNASQSIPDTIITAPNIPLDVAAGQGQLDVVKKLLEERADVNANVDRALFEAARRGHTAVASHLLRHGAHVNSIIHDKGSALQAATMNGHKAMVALLIDAGADINAIFVPYGNTLQVAAAHGYAGIVELLLKHGADVNSRAGLRGSALQIATAHGYTAIAQLLINAGADVNDRAGPGGSALQNAVAQGHTGIAQLLIDRGADVNDRAGPRESALEIASIKGDAAIVELLLKHGADLNAGADRNHSALDVARTNGHHRIVKILEALGARERSGHAPSSIDSHNPFGSAGRANLGEATLISSPVAGPNSIKRMEKDDEGSVPSTTRQLSEEATSAPPPSTVQSIPADSPTNRSIICDRCFESGIHVYHHCRQCPDSDLCESCFPLGCIESQDHTFSRMVQDAHSPSKQNKPASITPSIAPFERRYEEQDYTIKCLCGLTIEEQTTIRCKRCETWQHVECYYIDKDGAIPSNDALDNIKHFCVDCDPRPVDRKGATERQRVRWDAIVEDQQRDLQQNIGTDSDSDSPTEGSRLPSEDDDTGKGKTIFIGNIPYGV